jgi:hypothetical protein
MNSEVSVAADRKTPLAVLAFVAGILSLLLLLVTGRAAFVRDKP